MVCIKTYQKRLDADIAKNVLEAAGIPAFVTADDYGGWNPFKLGGLWVRLLVNELDAPKALEVLKNYYEPSEIDEASQLDDREADAGFPEQVEEVISKPATFSTEGRNWLALVILIGLALLVYVWIADAGRKRTRRRKPQAIQYFNSASDKHSEGDYDGAIADYGKVIELDPDNAAAFHCRATSKADKGDYDGAIADYDRALELYQAAGDSEWIAEVYAGRAYARLYKDDSAGALADSDRAIKLKPSLGAAYRIRGEAKTRKEDFPGAEDDLTRAIELAQGPWEAAAAYQARSYVMYYTNRPDRALRDATKALELYRQVGDKRGVVEMYNHRSDLNFIKGDYDGALADDNAAIEFDPTSSHAYSGRAFTYAKGLKQYDEAIKDCNKAIKLDSNNARAYSTRGYAYAASGQFEKAISDCEKSIKLEQSNGWNWYKYALVFALKRDREEMLEKLRKAIELDPIIEKECKSDEEFKPYRQDPEFQKLIGP